MKRKDVRDYLEMVWDNLEKPWCEAVLYYDGDMVVRMSDSWGLDDNLIVFRMPLPYAFWSAFPIWGEDGEKLESEKEYFISEWEEEIYKVVEIED